MNGNEKYKRGTILMAVFTAFLTTFVSSALNLSIPSIETEFNTNAIAVGWIVTAYTMGSAIFSVPFGKLADVVGRKKVLVVGITGFLVLSVMCAFARSIGTLIFIRLLHGVSAACLFATNNAILISVFPGSKRGQVLGVSVASTYTGLSVGPIIGGFLSSHFGWRSIFLVTAVIALASLVFAVTGCPSDTRDSGKSRPDILGNMIYMVMIASFLYGFSNIVNGFAGKALIALTLVLAAAFVWVEGTAENPIIKISMFTSDVIFTLSNIAALLNYAATFAVTYLVSIYLQVVMGFDPQTAGFILIAMPAMQAIFTPEMGKLSDRIPPYKLATAGMACCVAGLTCLALLTEGSSILHVVAALVVMGFGFALFSSPNTNSIMSRVRKEDYAVANSITSTMRTVGQSLSMALVNVIVTIRLGEGALSETSPDSLVGTMRICFIVCVIMCVVGTVISYKRAEA